MGKLTKQQTQVSGINLNKKNIMGIMIKYCNVQSSERLYFLYVGEREREKETSKEKLL